MNLFNKKKKGFTIVELVIVIAVIGVLAAILIPTFVGLVNRANVAADGTLVRELNNAIALDLAEKGEEKHATMTDALAATEKNGFVVQRIKSKTNTNKILWDSVHGVFCYLQENAAKVEYVPGSVEAGQELSAGDYRLWIISSTVDGTYSTYLYNYNGNGTVETSRGLDVGNEEVTSVTYKRTAGAAQEVVIRTNGGSLTINAANDTVKHYGEGLVLNIENVDTQNCYREFGSFANAQIKRGKVVIENGEANIDNLLLVAKSNKSGFEDIIVETKTGAKLPTLDRTDVEIASTGTLVVNVVTPSTNDFIYLTKAGVIEQIVVTEEKNNDVSSIAANVSSKSTTTQTAAEQVANVGKKNEDGTAYVDADGNDISLENLTSENIVVEEAKADDTAIQTGLTKFAGGAGTEKSPYLISNGEEYAAIETMGNGSYIYYKQIDNITINGTYGGIWGYARLSYDGQNFNIYSDNSLQGTGCLFYAPYKKCEMKNINFYSTSHFGLAVFEKINQVAECYITNCHSYCINNELLSINEGNFGFFISQSVNKFDGSLTIENCSNNVSVSNTGNCVSAVVGQNLLVNDDDYKNYTFTLLNFTNNGNIIGNTYAGLIKGNPSDVNYITASVNSTTEKLSGLIIENIVNNGVVSATYPYIFSCGSYDANFYWNTVYADDVTGTGMIITKTNEIISQNLSVTRTGNSYYISSANENYTYKLAYKVSAITYDINGQNISSSGRDLLIDLQVGNGESSLSTGNNIHAYDVNTAIEKGVVTKEETDSLSYTYNIENSFSIAIMYKDNNTYIIFKNESDGFKYVDSSVAVYVYGYSNNAFVGAKPIQ